MNNLPSEQLESMSLADIQAAYNEMPHRHDCRVYEVAGLLTYLDAELAVPDRDRQREINNLQELVWSTLPVDAIAAYYNAKAPAEKAKLVQFGVNLRNVSAAPIVAMPPHANCKWVYGLYDFGRLNQTGSQRAAYDTDNGYSADTEEWVKWSAETTTKRKYINDALGAETQEAEAEKTDKLANLDTYVAEAVASAIQTAMAPMVASMAQTMQAVTGGVVEMSQPMVQSAIEPSGAILMAAPDGAGEDITRYLLNTTGTTYHSLECLKASSGTLKTLAQIAESHPAAKPCAFCMPPALVVGA